MGHKISIIALLLCTTAGAPAWAQNATTAAAPAAAAQPSTDDAADVVVTGVRQSLRTSTAIKRNAAEVVDSISSEDIGKLPDLNVAETLTRVPGVQAYRFGGEAASPVGAGSGLTIRGLTGQTASRVDGRAYFTAGQREFNVEGASPGMVAGVDVYKNPSADHIEGAIGGLVNIRTRQPLDFKGTTFSVGLGGHYNDFGKKLTPDVFALGATRWKAGDGEIGFLIAGNYSKSFNRGDNNPANGGSSFRRVVAANSAEYTGNSSFNQAFAGRSDVSVLVPVSDPTTLTAAQRANVISAVTETNAVNEEDYMRTRKGLSTAFQWRPSDRLEFYVNGTYNDYLYHQRYRFLSPIDSLYVQNLTTAPFNLDEATANRNSNGGSNDVLASARLATGTFLNSTMASTGGEEHRRYQTGIVATGVKWKPTDHLDVNFDFSYIKARQYQDNRAVSMASKTGLTWSIARDLTSDPHTVQITGPDLSSPASWVWNQYNNGTNQIWHDNGVAAALDLKYRFDAGFLKDIKFGARYGTQRDHYNNYSYGKSLTTDGQPLKPDQSNAIAVAPLQALTETAPTNFQLGQAGYSGGYLVYSPDRLTGDQVRDSFTQVVIPANDALPEQLLARRYFSEKTYAGYVVADFGLFDDFITGNAGVRVVKTDTFVRAMVTDTTGTTPVVRPNGRNSSYTDVLPTLNLKASLTDNTFLRFGFGKGITRPDLGSLNPTIVVNTATGFGNVGNPDLKPQRADSYDLSLEHYFSSVNYAAVNIFYKRIDGFFSGISTCQSVSTAQPYNNAASPNGCSNGQYSVTQTVNAARGSARGVEATLQTFLDYPFMPDFLHKFGASGSFTYADTRNPLTLNGIRVVTPQPLTSKYSYSASGFFDNGTISARLVYTWRSPSILFGVSANPMDGRYIKAYGLLDASVTVKLPYNLSLAVTAANITNNAGDRYVGEPALQTGIQRQHFVNGRNFGATLRYTFGG